MRQQMIPHVEAENQPTIWPTKSSGLIFSFYESKSSVRQVYLSFANSCSLRSRTLAVGRAWCGSKQSIERGSFGFWVPPQAWHCRCPLVRVMACSRTVSSSCPARFLNPGLRGTLLCLPCVFAVCVWCALLSVETYAGVFYRRRGLTSHRARCPTS